MSDEELLIYNVKPDDLPINKALIACDGLDYSFIMERSGRGIDIMMEEYEFKTPEDLGIDPEEFGLWVWEGIWETVSIETPHGREYDREAVGAFRRPTIEELQKMAKGETIF